jgi:hypothetical protein
MNLFQTIDNITDFYNSHLDISDLSIYDGVTVEEIPATKEEIEQLLILYEQREIY